jgi:hypothetical protein
VNKYLNGQTIISITRTPVTAHINQPRNTSEMTVKQALDGGYLDNDHGTMSVSATTQDGGRVTRQGRRAMAWYPDIPEGEPDTDSYENYPTDWDR